MKPIICLHLCGVLLLFCLSAVTSQRSNCCLKTSNNKIPISRVKDYRIQTAGTCQIDAIVLITVKDRELCCDPKSDWIKEILTMVDEKKSKTKQNSDSTASQDQNVKKKKKEGNRNKNGNKRRRQKKQKGQK